MHGSFFHKVIKGIVDQLFSFKFTLRIMYGKKLCSKARIEDRGKNNCVKFSCFVLVLSEPLDHNGDRVVEARKSITFFLVGFKLSNNPLIFGKEDATSRGLALNSGCCIHQTSKSNGCIS